MSRRPGPLLAVDIGNTNVHWRLFGADRAAGTGGRCPTAEAPVAAQLLAQAAGDAGKVPVGVCSVVPSAEAQVTAALSEAGLEVSVLGREVPVSVRTGYADPTEIGLDRLANAAGAFALTGGPCVVAAVGTAITVDAVGADGTHLGGAIAPGPEAALAGLLARVSGPSLRRLDEPETRAALLAAMPSVSAPGTSTPDCLRLGLRLGFAGLLDRLVQEHRSLVGDGAAVIGTGGALAALLRYCRVALRPEPELTLLGIREVWLAAGGAR